jgi:hypothetical protein
MPVYLFAGHRPGPTRDAGYVAAQRDEEFLLPDRPPRKSIPRINPFPTTDGHRRRLHVKPAKKPKPLAPTVRAVKEIGPQQIIPRLNRLPQKATGCLKNNSMKTAS